MKQKMIAMLVITMLLLVSPAVGQQYQWGVDDGDSFVYWLEDLSTSFLTGGQNLAALMTDANRTTIVAFTNVTENHVEYIQTTGIKVNETSSANEITLIAERFNQTQSYSISAQTIGGQLLILPNGSLPYALPLSTPDYSDYLDYFRAVSGTAGSLVSSLLGSTLNITSAPVDVDSNFESGLFKVAAHVSLGSLNVSGILNGTGFELPAGLLENITAGIQLDYNLTDGGLSGLSMLFNSSISIANSSQNQFVDLFLNLTRTHVFRFESTGGSSDMFLFFVTLFGGSLLLALPILWSVLRRPRNL